MEHKDEKAGRAEGCVSGAAGVWRRRVPDALMERLLQEQGVPVGRKSRKVGDGGVAGAIVMRHLRGVGGLAAGGSLLQNKGMSESAYAQRRADLPKELFDRLCALTLGAIAEQEHEPEAFLQGRRLVAIDGVKGLVRRPL